jgi:hypothetical protein
MGGNNTPARKIEKDCLVLLGLIYAPESRGRDPIYDPSRKKNVTIMIHL